MPFAPFPRNTGRSATRVGDCLRQSAHGQSLVLAPQPSSTSLTLGQAFALEQVEPDSGLVATISLPNSLNGEIRSLMLTLAEDVPVTGPPAALLAEIHNLDLDENGIGDIDEILNSSRDLILALDGEGILPGDYMATSIKIPLG